MAGSYQEDLALENPEDGEIGPGAKGFDEYAYVDEGIDEADAESDSGVRYPNIHVRLVGQDGNVYSILGAVHRALSRAGVPKAEIDAFKVEATSGNYDAVLQTCLRWVVVH